MVDADPEPFVGPRPFEIDDADRFCARSRESWDLTYSGLLSRRLVVLSGPAGVGKTSLLKAGVLAMIRVDMAHVLPVANLRRSPAGGPTRANPFVVDLLSAWAPEASADVLRDQTLSGYLRTVPSAASRPIIAVIDQFETVLGGGPALATESEQFLEQLAQAMEDVPHLHLVLAVRQDVVDRLAPYESRLSGGDGWRYQLGPLSPGAALDAVTHPLRGTPRSFAPGVAELLVDNLRTTTITDTAGAQRTVVAATVEATILQVVCAELWRALPDDVTTIGAQHLRDLGDVEMALTGFCLRAVIDVSVTAHQPLHLLWDWLETTFVTDLGTRGSAYEGRETTAGMPNAVARAFEHNHILRAEERSEAVWYELLHDGLVEPVRRGRRFVEGLTALAGSDAPVDAFLLMAESALKSGQLADAEQFARGAVRANQHDLRTLAEAKAFLGKLVFDQGVKETGARAEEFYATAEDSFQSAAELYETSQNAPAVGRALASLGRLQLKRGRYGEALAQLRGALDRVRGDIHIRVDFARALTNAGQLQAALCEYTHVLTDDPGTVEALIGRGTLSASRGDATSALRDLDTAIRIQPDVAERAEVIAARSQASAHLDHRR